MSFEEAVDVKHPGVKASRSFQEVVDVEDLDVTDIDRDAVEDGSKEQATAAHRARAAPRPRTERETKDALGALSPALLVRPSCTHGDNNCFVDSVLLTLIEKRLLQPLTKRSRMTICANVRQHLQDYHNLEPSWSAASQLELRQRVWQHCQACHPDLAWQATTSWPVMKWLDDDTAVLAESVSTVPPETIARRSRSRSTRRRSWVSPPRHSSPLTPRRSAASAGMTPPASRAPPSPTQLEHQVAHQVAYLGLVIQEVLIPTLQQIAARLPALARRPSSNRRGAYHQ
jgi:hypothetical protein